VARLWALTFGLAPVLGGPGVARAQSGDFTCTEFIGYSQTRQWYLSGFGPAVGWAGAWQLRARDAAAVEFWADPGFVGWDPSTRLSHCGQSGDNPDRIVLDVTNDYQADVNWWIGQINTAVQTIHAKFPSVRQIVLQPVVGGPGGGQCRFGGNIVRASYNHPVVDQAIASVAGDDVVVGADPTVRTCADYADDIGHLTPDAQVAIGTSILNFYMQSGGGPSADGGTASDSGSN
jgi:hypothetical protein